MMALNFRGFRALRPPTDNTKLSEDDDVIFGWPRPYFFVVFFRPEHTNGGGSGDKIGMCENEAPSAAF